MQYTTHATGGSRITGVFAAYIAGDIPSAIPIKMSTEEECILLLLLHRQRQRRKRRDRRWYVRPLNTTRDRDGEFVSLVLPMRSLDEERHFQYFRMSAPKFDDLLSRVIRYLPDSHQNRPLSGSSWQIIFCQMLACFPTSTMCYDWVCALTNKYIYIGHLEA